MATPLQFTEAFREEELARGRQSLYYFSQAILGFDRLGDLQWDLAAFLEGRPPHQPWNRAVVCAYRGSYKSTMTTQSYPLWRTLYIPDFSVKIIENSAENAKINHFVPMVDLFMSSRRAPYLQWLYRHRIPENFKDWNKHQIQFVKENPLSGPSISYWGIDSKFEGWHGNLVVIDDPEGADAEKGQAANDDSWRLWGRVQPLLEEPAKDQVLGVMTPHGANPLAYRLRDRELEGQIDNERRHVKMWWMPILDENDKPREPHRFPPSAIEMMKMERETWNTQYMLRRPGAGETIFDMEAIFENSYEWVGPGRQLIRYQAFEFDPDVIGEDGIVVPKKVSAQVSVQDLRFFIHADPTHKLNALRKSKTNSSNAPSLASIVVVGVAPDSHAFVIEPWTGDVDLDGFTRQVYRLYRLYAPEKVTFEPTGAQVWFTTFVKSLERGDPRYRFMTASGLYTPKMPIPNLSARLVEADSGNKSKEDIYRERLSAWLNYGTLHIHRKQEELLHQLDNVLVDTAHKDLLDALAQGPPVWKPYPSRSAMAQYAARARFVQTFVRAKRTGYYRPWATQEAQGSVPGGTRLTSIVN